MDYKRSLVYALKTIANCLKTDFGHLYSAQFKSEKDLGEWKKRIWEKMNGMHPQDILDGYDAIVDAKPSHLPTIPELLESTLTAQKNRRKQESNKAESARVGLLPPKQEIPDSVARENFKKIREMLGNAMDKIDDQETKTEREERLVRLKQKWDAHETLLDNGFPNRDKEFMPHPSHECSVGWCRKPGTITSSTTGNGNYFCIEHFRG
jgi:hypothetical protein